MNDDLEDEHDKHRGKKSLALHWLYKASQEERYVYQIEVVEKAAHQYYVGGKNWEDAMDRFKTQAVGYYGGPEDVDGDYYQEESCNSVVQDEHVDYYDPSAPKKVRRIKQYRFDNRWFNQQIMKDNAVYMACSQATTSRVLSEYMGVGYWTELKLHLEE